MVEAHLHLERVFVVHGAAPVAHLCEIDGERQPKIARGFVYVKIRSHIPIKTISFMYVAPDLANCVSVFHTT